MGWDSGGGIFRADRVRSPIFRENSVRTERFQYHTTITFLRTDNEPALGDVFQELLAQHGIQHEQIAPYTPVQNGQIERSRGVMIQKARCMCISANSPTDLCPETISAAAYILNRTPMSRTILSLITKVAVVPTPTWPIKPKLHKEVFAHQHSQCIEIHTLPYSISLSKLQKDYETLRGCCDIRFETVWHCKELDFNQRVHN